MSQFACKLFRLILAAITLSIFGGFLTAQKSASVPVILKVTDPTGFPIPHAQIELIPSPSPGILPGTMQTDSAGRLALNLKRGGYCIRVHAPGFTDIEDHFNAPGPATISLKVMIGAGLKCVAVHGCTTCVTAPQRVHDSNTLLLRALPYRLPPITLSQSDLRTLPHITITTHNRNLYRNVDERYSGVRLIELLEKVGVPGGYVCCNDLSDYIVARGSDGSKVVLSLAEVDRWTHQGEVIVADTMNGEPLDAKSGPFQLIITEDKRPDRLVRHLVSVDVRQAR